MNRAERQVHWKSVHLLLCKLSFTTEDAETLLRVSANLRVLCVSVVKEIREIQSPPDNAVTHIDALSCIFLDNNSCEVTHAQRRLCVR